MSTRHFAHWPKGLPRHMSIPQTDLFYNVEVSAPRFPDKACLVFYDTRISFAGFKDEAERIAGWLQGQGVQKGDRVLLCMHNSQQFVVAYYGILRANAVVVPVNPMNMTIELRTTSGTAAPGWPSSGRTSMRRCGRCWETAQARASTRSSSPPTRTT